MQRTATLGAVLILAASAAAQRPREDDMHERLTRRLEATIATQKQVLEDIRSLLKTSVEQKQLVEIEKVRFEVRGEVETLKTRMAKQSTEIESLKRSIDDAKRRIEDLDGKNRILASEAATLRAELAARADSNLQLQFEIAQLKAVIKQERKKNDKGGTKNR